MVDIMTKNNTHDDKIDPSQATAPNKTGVQHEELFLDDNFDGPKITLARTVITFLIVIMAAGAFGALAWYAYQSSSQPTDIAFLPTIAADNSPTKVKPEEPGGMVVPNMDKTIYDHISGTPSNDNLPKVERLLPSPEEPVDRATLGSQEETPAPTTEQTNNTVETPLAETPTPQDSANIPPATSTAKAIVITPPPSKEGTIKSDDLTLVPEGTSQRNATDVQKSGNAAGIKVQLASVKSEKDAVETWNKLKKTHPELLGKLDYYIERKDLGSKGVFYRLQAGPISGSSEARLLCKKLTDLGQGCLVVK
jgi:cell division septation protein DedD